MLNELETLAAPMNKLAELNKVTVEKLVEAQKSAVQEVVALTEARVKAASEIKDAEGLQAFVEAQVELAKNSYEKAINDTRVMTEDLKAYNEEVVKLIQEGTEEVQKAVKEAAAKAA